MTRQFHWQNGSGRRFAAVPADEFAAWLETLPDKRPETILRFAKNPRCIAHKLFSWDAKANNAAHLLMQARTVLACLVVDVVIETGTAPRVQRVRAVVQTSRGGLYENVDIAFTNPTKRSFVLAQALAELRSIQRRYAAYEELATVFEAIAMLKTRRRSRRASVENRPSV